MARKSNKTAHVLGLITQEKQPSDMPEEAEITSEGNGEASSPKPSRRAVVRKATPNMVKTNVDDHSKLAEDIREKLLEELDGPAPAKKASNDAPAEPPTQASSVPTETTPEPAPVAETAPAEQMPQPMPQEDNPADYTAPETVAAAPNITASVADYPLEDFGAPPQAESQKETAPSPPSILDVPTPNTPAAAAVANSPYIPPNDATYLYINVLEELVKERTLEQMQMNGTCLCNRCVMDTMALTLTNLPSKYIVVEKGQGIPLLNYYGTKFQIQVISELTKACMVVKNFPHH